VGGLLTQLVPIHLDDVHHPWAQGVAQLPPDHLAQDGQPGYLQAAGGAAGTAAHKHQHQQYHLAQRGPHGKVCGDKACGAHDGGHLECRLPQRNGEGLVQGQNVDGNGRHGHQNDACIHLELRVSQKLGPAFEQEQVVEVEVHAEQEHERRQHPLDVGAKVGSAGVVRAKAAGACGAQGVHHAVKQAHAAEQEEHDLQHG